MGNIPEPAPESEPAPPAGASLLPNGDFSNGADHWRLSGSAAIESGAAVLASGSNTDRMTQTVRLQRGKTYTLIVLPNAGRSCNLALMTIMDAIPRQSRRYPRPVNIR